MTDYSIISCTQVSDVHIVHISVPDLSDREIVGALEQELSDYVRGCNPVKFVVDFSSVRFLTSEMLSALLRVRELAHGLGCTMRLSGLSHTVREVFRITQLDRIFPITDDSSEGVAAFGG